MRLFILGDSFSDNLFEVEYKRFNEERLDSTINRYLKKIHSEGSPRALWFTDHLESWGYDIHNFGDGGCSMEEIFYQLSKIDKEFKEDDRLIINLTSPNRFIWIMDDGNKQTIHQGAGAIDDEKIKEYFQRQAINRNFSFEKDKYLGNSLISFVDYLAHLHKKYSPIIWSPFQHVSEKIKDLEWFFFEPTNNMLRDIIPDRDKLLISEETKMNIKDNHYGRYGNYYLAVIFDTILREGKNSYYIKDNDLMNRIQKNITERKIKFSDIDFRSSII
jgi:hypothetical protein